MKVFIKNKFWSLGGGSSVVNENKEPVFKVKGRIFSITRVKYVCDMQGNRLFKIRNKWFNWFIHKAYIYDANKTKIATVKDKYFTVRNEFFVEGYKDEIKIDGKFLSFHSKILRNGEVMGTIDRKFTIVKDAFMLEANEEDIPFLIALVIAMDNICDKRTKLGIFRI